MAALPLPLPATVLVVDEVEANRAPAVHLLRLAGYRVIEAATGAAALRLARVERPGLIVLDAQLPDLDGLAVTRRLRADPVTRRTPILLLSKLRNGGAGQARALEGGADAWLAHPPEPDVLVATAGALLRASHAEASLEAQETRTRKLLDQVREHAIFLLTPDGRVASWNEGVRRALGYDEDEFVGMDSRTLFTPEDRAGAVPDRELAEARARGTASDDRWMLRKDGTRVWVSGAITALREDGGAVAGFAKVLRDLTESKRAEDALRDSRQRLQMAVAAARLGSWDHDPATGAITWLPGTAALFGRPEGALGATAREFLELVHPEDRERVRGVILQGSAPEGELGIEFRVLRADGTIAWIQGASRVEAAAGASRVVGVGVDVTEQKLAQDRVQLAAKMQAVGQLAGGVAHEINNQIMVLMGFTDFLVEGLPADDPRQGDLSEVAKAARRVAFITRQLLAFSRQEVRETSVFAPNTALVGMEGLLSRMLGSDIACVFELDPAAGAVEMDQAQFEGVILNLALNARDAMPRGGRLLVGTAPLAVDEAYARSHGGIAIPLGSYVRVTVSDTGHGMDEATRLRAFEPFFTTKPEGQGTGLGLASVYGVVKHGGGFIWVDSAPGRGTEFTIDLPAAGRHVTTGEVLEDGRAHGGAAGAVLLVEDEASLRSAITRMLVRSGYRVTPACDAAAALEVLADVPRPDVVLTDLVMPGMSGWDLGQRLAAAWPGLPILYMTGYGEDEVLRRGLLRPGAHLLRKPFTADELGEALEATCRAGVQRAGSRSR